MKTLLAALLLLAPAWANDPIVDGPSDEWLKAHAPYGFDITLDGKVWVNTNTPGARDDYAILGKDLEKALSGHSSNPRLWVRGYHRRNPGVTYRETKQLINVDCARDTIWIERKLYYSADGDLITSTGPFASEPIVPGSIGESWRKAACAS